MIASECGLHSPGVCCRFVLMPSYVREPLLEQRLLRDIDYLDPDYPVAHRHPVGRYLVQIYEMPQ